MGEDRACCKMCGLPLRWVNEPCPQCTEPDHADPDALIKGEFDV